MDFSQMEISCNQLLCDKPEQHYRRFGSRAGCRSSSISCFFFFSWPSHLLYTFPPVTLVLRVIRKLKWEKATLILIAPAWPRKYWYMDLQQLSVQSPIFLSISGRGSLVWEPGQVSKPQTAKSSSILHDNWASYAQDVQGMLVNCRKDSTRATYAANWRRFLMWAELHHLSPFHTETRHILNYLLYLKSTGLSVSLMIPFGSHFSATPTCGWIFSLLKIVIVRFLKGLMYLLACFMSGSTVGPEFGIVLIGLPFEPTATSFLPLC